MARLYHKIGEWQGTDKKREMNKQYLMGSAISAPQSETNQKEIDVLTIAAAGRIIDA
jgi:hypothetical protein